MKLIEKAHDAVTIQVTRDELYLLHGSMRETLEELNDWEFPTRMGAEIPELRELLSQFGDLIDEVKSLKED